MHKQPSRKAGSDDLELIVELRPGDMEMITMKESVVLELDAADRRCKRIVFILEDSSNIPGGMHLHFKDYGTLWLNGEFIGESKKACVAAMGISKWNVCLDVDRDGVSMRNSMEQPNFYFMLGQEVFFTMTSKTPVIEVLAGLQKWGEAALARQAEMNKKDGLPNDCHVQRDAANVVPVGP